MGESGVGDRKRKGNYRAEMEMNKSRSGGVKRERRQRKEPGELWGSLRPEEKR
jgi:hypothetical protein